MSAVSVGQRYSRLVVVGLIQDRKNPKAECQCDCGSIVHPQRGALKNGRAKSCGCLRRELLAAHSEASRLPKEIVSERRAKSHQKWVKENNHRWREINNAAIRRHYSKNPDAAKRNCRARRARLVGASGIVSKGIDQVLLKYQKGRCACCRELLKSGSTHLDHITPLAKGGLHEDRNLQLLCAGCNLRKGSKDPVDFMRSRGFLL